MCGANGNVLALGALDARTHLFLSCHLSAPLLLLAADLLTRALAGACIGVGTLTANGQTLAVTKATVAADFHEALHVLGRSPSTVRFSWM